MKRNNTIYIVTDNLLFGEKVRSLINELDDYLFSGYISIKRSEISYRKRILGDILDLFAFENEINVSLAIKDSYLRRCIYYFLKKNKKIKFVNLIHPTCIISPQSIVREGLIAFPHSKIEKDSIVQECVIMMENSSIGEKTRVEKFCLFDERSSLGDFSVMLQESQLGVNSHILNGAVINPSEKIPSNTVYFL